MNQSKLRSLFQWTPLVLLGILLLLSPYAMSFPPIYGPDPLVFQRSALVGFGLVTCIVSFLQFADVSVRNEWALLPPSAATFFASFGVGWRCFPYWVNGAYQVGIGAFSGLDQDPKSLVPMTWIGELWRLPISFFQFAIVFAGPILLIATILLLWHRRFVSAIITVCGTLIAAVFAFHSTNDYFTWLLD